MLSKASVLAYETVPQSRLKEPSAELQALFPGFSDMNYYPPQSNALSTSENAITAPKNSKSSDVSGTTGADSIATSATTESLDEEEGNSDNRRPRGIRDDPLMLEVAVCMLRYINR